MPVPNHLSSRIVSVLDALEPLLTFESQSVYARRRTDPGICDFVYGNPHDMPPPGFVEALQHWVVPQSPNWFGYKMSEPSARAAIAASLRRQRGAPFEANDIFLTTGAFAGIAVALASIADPGDEVLILSPAWPFYEPLVAAHHARPVRARVRSDTFDLDLEAIAAGITGRTRAIIVNSPNNPTGKIYPPETLRGLARLLTAASERSGRPIYLLSDEAYCRIVYDGRAYHSPAAFYPDSFVIYTYGKTLLTPGQRVGYIALPPGAPGRRPLRRAIWAAQLVTGYAFPNALLQYAVPELEGISIDVAHLQGKRDRMVSELRRLGYEVSVPEGTFYLLVRSPLTDDRAFIDVLAGHGVFCLPGSVLDLSGYFRISLTASDEMIEHALPAFARARQVQSPAR